MAPTGLADYWDAVAQWKTRGGGESLSPVKRQFYRPELVSSVKTGLDVNNTGGVTLSTVQDDKWGR